MMNKSAMLSTASAYLLDYVQIIEDVLSNTSMSSSEAHELAMKVADIALDLEEYAVHEDD